jgi:hypothetical protein
MPTTITKTVQGGGDYTTLAAFESGEQRDLVAADEIARALCGNFQDTAFADFFGWTLDEDHYYIAEAADDHQCVGSLTTNAYRLVRAGTCAKFRDFFRVIGIQFVTSGNVVSVDCAPALSAQSLLDKCFVTGTGSSGGGIINGGVASTLNIRNCISISVASSYSLTTSGIGANQSSIYSSVLRGVQHSNSGGTSIYKNCYAWRPTTLDAYRTTAGAVSMTTCASSDTSGSAGLHNIPFDDTTFEDTSSIDLTPFSSSPLADVGTDTSGDSAPMNFTDDILGTTRPEGTDWDVGAIELIGGGVGGAIATPTRYFFFDRRHR